MSLAELNDGQSEHPQRSRLIAAEILSAPEMIAQLIRLAERIVPALALLFEQLTPVAEYVRSALEAPRAPDYEACLIALGYPADEARLLSLVVITFGERYARDWDGCRRELGSAM